jgi:hypothetical protein
VGHFNKNIRRMTEVGLTSKWKRDLESKQKLVFVSSPLSHGKYSFGNKNIVADSMYEKGYFPLCVAHLAAALLALLVGCLLSITVLIAELVYRRLLGNT